MKLIKMILILSLLKNSFFLIPLLGQKAPLKEFGYDGEYWDIEKISLKVKLCKKGYEFEFNAFQNDKRIISRNGDVSYDSVKEFWNFIEKKSILKLKSASLTDPNTKDEDFESLYCEKGIDHQSAIIYKFNFIVDDKKVNFKIDDIKNISDGRYFELLQKLNCLVKQPSFKTVFEYHKYLNDRKESN